MNDMNEGCITFRRGNCRALLYLMGQLMESFTPVQTKISAMKINCCSTLSGLSALRGAHSTVSSWSYLKQL